VWCDSVEKESGHEEDVRQGPREQSTPGRPAARDLTARKGGAVKGGGVNHSELSIVKLVDKATPKLYEK
jgi:type VI protein secretion system component Hcp